ncbi:MAG: ABC transporter permease [Candidatus Eremiobacteraeota bacterium]|nr:ABC transporter permease [Candidatus Eremiobacteraeota bacterium]MBC5826141.1 ABC transporter permease [Candidatus Eremiobacteraeota bacterium]
MSSYISRRLVGLVPLLFGISIISYAMMGLAPGGPAAIFAGMARQMTPADRAVIMHNLGLDRPWYVQYFYWLKNLLVSHSLGYSFIDGRPVMTKILEKLPVTAELIGISFAVTMLVAIPVAIYSATHKNSAIDYLATVIVFVGYGMPIFWLGIVLLNLFSVRLHWLPSSGLTNLGVSGFDLADRVRHLILPVATLSFVSLAAWIRYQRSSMIEVLGEDFIRTAAAKGLGRWTVVYKHAFRNALLPLITLIGLYLPALLTGAYFVEIVFSIPGMGYIGLNAIFERDYPTIMGTVFFSAVLVVLGNLFADIAYAAVDPRIRYD